MSNDNIWITCTTCGERTKLAGYLPSCDLSIHHSNTLLTFFEYHFLHHPASIAFKPDLERNPGFVFETDGQIGDRHGWVKAGIKQEL
jgi:hypothetical protein